jgi:uncharacterized membrane-anchored protein
MNSKAKVDVAKYRLYKVPKITAFFWVIKILSTAMGEATSDALVEKLSPVVAVPLALIILFIALRIQFSAKQYVPRIYWFAVSAVAIFGTMAADGVHLLGVPYIASSSIYAVILAAIFYLWYKTEGTLSIHSIDSVRRERFYWLTVFATFALGTAIGDLCATRFNLGFLNSGLMFIGIFLIPTVLYLVFKANGVFTFWFAYILTRPLGASFADWFGKPQNIGGLNIGDPTVSITFIVIIVILVTYMTRSHLDEDKSNFS